MKTLYQVRLCETREYTPRILEHWLHTLQKHPHPIEFWIREKDGKVELLCSEDLSAHLPGSRLVPEQETPPDPSTFFVSQSKGPLLPIKRYAQFEDRVQKTHLTPLSQLLPQLMKTPGGCIHFSFTPLPDRQRERALKKAKKPYFEPERHFDQWESRGWFSLTLRRFLGPILRKSLLHTPQKVAAQEQIESLHEREDPRRAVLDKLSRPLFTACISMSHPFADFIHGFTLPYLGELRLSKKPCPLLFSAEEIATLLSLPNAKEHAAQLSTEPTAYLPAPSQTQLSEEDRKRHLYLLGKTGMGKSTMLLKLFQEDAASRSVLLLDPHGDLVEDALALIPTHREKDTLFLDPSDANFPLALNPLECKPGDNAHLKTSALVEMFEVLAQGSWGPRLEYILRNALLLLVLSPNTTLLDLPRVLTSEVFCRQLLSRVSEFELHRFFEEEFLALDSKTRQEHSAPILNKVGPLLTLPLLRNIFGQPKSKISFEEIFKENRIVLVTLSKGKLGEDCSRMLGMVFIALLQSMLLRRAELPVAERRTLCLTIDEFQNFSTKTLLTMLAESRKYGLALTLANQYLTQLPPEIQDAVLGNAGSLLCFRSSFADAQILAASLGLIEEDLTQLAPFQAYAKLLQDQRPLPLFRLDVAKPSAVSQVNTEQIKTRSLQRTTRPRSLVEEKLKIRYNYR